MQDPDVESWLTTSGARLLRRNELDYPAQLAALADPPPVLYVLGDASLLQEPQIAVIGSRQPTAAGRSLAARMAGDLATAGLVITSGLARGIDAAAHEAALAAGGKTIAVCGTGLDICYPAQHRALFERIAREGLLVSEFPPGTPPRAAHFPQRNRVISGLSRGVVVVEAAADSGSLITARHALAQGREVFAVPGSPLNPLAAGCLELLRQGATLVRGAADVLPEIAVKIEGNVHAHQQLGLPIAGAGGSSRLDKDYEMLLDALGFEPSTVDDLVERTGLGPGSIASMLLILELEGRVEARPGALYNRVA
ncbi:MAG: DNA-processing protein DprA [Pseudomonadota bacterium]